MLLKNIDLQDRFTRVEGELLLSGMQALVRIPLVQSRADRAAGLNTAGLVTGYRGSPLGMIDHAFMRAQNHLEAEGVRFQPAVNEELAATAIYGAQQFESFGKARYDGVFSMWYGKGPGVDRAGDALKHGNLAGTHPNGGVLALAGDDHPGKSSTTAHQSEQALVAAMMPVLYPADIQEYLDYGAFGFALSRFSGLWIGFKCVNDTADATATAIARSYDFGTPKDFELPPGGLNIQKSELQVGQERRLVDFRLPAAEAFARHNRLDRVIVNCERRELGIITAGKAYHDVMRALEILGQPALAGLRVYKLGMTWPIERTGVASFCAGHRRILVVEEKRAFIEPQVKDALYHLPADSRPEVVGKTDASGKPLMSSTGELTPELCLDAIIAAIEDLGVADAALAARIAAIRAGRAIAPGGAVTPHPRPPFYCSGCPHNTSTTVPAGSIGLAGIGCHVMAALMPHRQHLWPVQMGGEGANWVGAAPFVETQHVFQNLGDGTYFHSGFLAIRAAIAAKASITYKLLVNDAVAMTGGQPIEGTLNVAQLSRELLQEGAVKIVIVSDDPGRYPSDLGIPSDVPVRHRDDLDLVQGELRAIEGVTVLIYDQVCAAEKRRRRKRGSFTDPAKRVFVNDLVCEGCGDCSVKSNCVSVQPLETEFGRKRQIDQSSCNKDYSCVKGFCPSFVTVHGGELRGRASQARALVIPDLPVPVIAKADRALSILIPGIGGTGVVTIGAVLAMAAHLEGKFASIVDMTGLSQKNGAVLSHVKISDRPDAIHAARISIRETDILLACDMIVAGNAEVGSTLIPGETAGVINNHVTPTAVFQMMPDVDFQGGQIAQSLGKICNPESSIQIDATDLAVRLFGDSIASNMILLGVALQKGLLPISADSVVRAIELNGVAVTMNKAALGVGRWAAIDGAAVDREAAERSADVVVDMPAGSLRPSSSLDEMIARRTVFLTAYQNRKWADRYSRLVDRVRRTETMIGSELPLTEAVARSLFKLMAYKDEYEVARLYTDGEFLAKIGQQFIGSPKLRFYLAPPILAPKSASGEPRKMSFGGWMLPAFRILANFRGLRGTPFDPFGYTHERKVERRLIVEYEAIVEELCGSLLAHNRSLAAEIAAYPQTFRGYGHIKERTLAKTIIDRDVKLADFRDANAVKEAA